MYKHGGKHKDKRKMYAYGGGMMEKKKMMGGGRVQYAHGGSHGGKSSHKSIQDMERACKKMAGSNYHDEG